MFVDGEFVGTREAGTYFPLTIESLTVGQDFDGSNKVVGSLDELRIWNSIRTPEQIRLHANGQLGGNERGLVGYWPFNELPGSTTMTDRTANGYDGTLGAGDEHPRLTRAGEPITEGRLIALDALRSSRLGNVRGTSDTVNRSYLWTVVASNGQIVAAGSEATYSFTPNDDGDYTVNLKVTDTFVPSGRVLDDVIETTIHVENFVPEITLSGNGPVSEGAYFPLESECGHRHGGGYDHGVSRPLGRWFQ